MQKVVDEVLDSVRRNNFVSSNMTCCVHPQYIQGKRVYWASILYSPVAAPSISLLSLNDTVRITGMSNTGILPEIR